MAKNFYWFNLPTTAKTKLNIDSGRAAAIACIDDAAFNIKVAGLKWYRLPEKVQDMVDQINTEATVAAPTLVGMSVNWFNLVDSIDALYLVVQNDTLCV
jgi:hypothetical protein